MTTHAHRGRTHPGVGAQTRRLLTALSILVLVAAFSAAPARAADEPYPSTQDVDTAWTPDMDPSELGNSIQHRPDSLSYSPELVAQAGAQRLSDQIHQAVQDGGLDGFLGTAVAPGELTLHWKGELPATVAALVEEAGVEVRVRPAPFSRTEAHRAIRHLLDNPPAALPAGALTRAGVASDFSGIEAFVKPRLGLSLEALELPATYQGIPVSWGRGTEARPLLGRWDDDTPYRGGASIYRVVDPDEGTVAYCTTAFPATLDASGTPGILTAFHCGFGTWRVPATGAFVGSPGAGDGGLDTFLLTGGLSYGAQTYVGSYQSSSQFGIQGAADPAMNTLVYPQGAWSGGSEIRVVEVDQFVATDGGTLGPGFIAEHEDDVPSVGQGDSGGPVVTPVPGGSLDATARGLISQGFSPFSIGDECVGLTHEERICSARTFHINIDAIEDDLLLTVNTE